MKLLVIHLHNILSVRAPTKLFIPVFIENLEQRTFNNSVFLSRYNNKLLFIGRVFYKRIFFLEFIPVVILKQKKPKACMLQA